MEHGTFSLGYARIFDQVLAEITAGRIEDGVSLLAGMLDMASLQVPLLDQAVEVLHAHPLHALLCADPLYAASPESPGNDRALIDLIVRGEPDPATSPTGRRLFAATSQLPLCRAVRQRRSGLERRIARAWQQGQRICVLGGEALVGVSGLAARDLGNITVVESDGCTLRRLADRFDPSLRVCTTGLDAFLGELADGPFDLICLGESADGPNTPQLGRLIAALRPRLSGKGTIALAGLMPQHFGAGWRRAYLDWHPSSHDLSRLDAAATAARLETRQFHDDTGCMVWSEMTLAPAIAAVTGGNLT